MVATQHPALERYSISERCAIEVHKYYLGLELGYDPSFEEVVESWETLHANAWRRGRMRRDAELQIHEIERFRELLSHQVHHAVGFQEAARAWVEQWANVWRDQRDAIPDPSV